MTTIQQWQSAAKAAYPERDDAVRALLVGATAGLNVLLEGPPGTGKTALVGAFAQACKWSLFEATLSSWTDDASLLGPVDLGALSQGRLERHAAGFLADCDVAFLDELPRAGRGIRDLVLSALSNRRLPDGTPVRARMICAAANSALTDEEDLALADRFALVVRVDKVIDPAARLGVILGGGNPTLPPLFPPPVDAYKAVPVPASLSDAFATMSAEIGSVRRWIAAVKGCQAHALLHGRAEVAWDDVRAVLPLALPGPGDVAGDVRAQVNALIDEHGPQGDIALAALREKGEYLMSLGERDPSTLSNDEAAAYNRRWNTISKAVASIKREYPSVAAEAEEYKRTFSERDSEALMAQLARRVQTGKGGAS